MDATLIIMGALVVTFVVLNIYARKQNEERSLAHA